MTTAGTADARRAGGHHAWVNWLLAWSAVAPGGPAWGRGLRLAAAMIVPLTVRVIVGQPTAGLLKQVLDQAGPQQPAAAAPIIGEAGDALAHMRAAALEQLTDSIARLRRILGRLPAGPNLHHTFELMGNNRC